MESKGNYKNYRARLAAHQSAIQPCLPYVGLILRDLTLLEESMETRIDVPTPEGDAITVLHQDKLAQLSGVIRQMEQFRKRNVEQRFCGYVSDGTSGSATLHGLGPAAAGSNVSAANANSATSSFSQAYNNSSSSSGGIAGSSKEDDPGLQYFRALQCLSEDALNARSREIQPPAKPRRRKSRSRSRGKGGADSDALRRSRD
jgi:hypothetical protein